MYIIYCIPVIFFSSFSFFFFLILSIHLFLFPIVAIDPKCLLRFHFIFQIRRFGDGIYTNGYRKVHIEIAARRWQSCKS